MMKHSDILEQIINILGIKNYRIKKDEVWCTCLNPDHEDRHIGNFSINLKSGKFFCFACGYRGTLINLMFQKGSTYTQSLTLWKNLRLDYTEKPPDFERPLDKYILDVYINNPVSEYALNRVRDLNVLYEYNVVSDEKGNPVFLTKNSRGEFNSIWVRENGNYYLIEPLTAKETGVLYGEHITPTDYTIICEGPFDAFATRRVLKERSICTFGTQLSSAQISKLRKMGNLVIMFDGDRAGRRARDTLLSNVEAFTSVFLCGGYLDDPDELSDAQMCQIFRNRRSAVQYRLERIKDARNKIIS